MDSFGSGFATVMWAGAAAVVAYLVAVAASTRFSSHPKLWYCLSAGFLLSTTYFANLGYARFVLHGSVYHTVGGDASFLIGFANNVIHGNLLGDIFEKRLPVHYPPLYFWFSGTVARLFGWNAMEVWFAMPPLWLAVLPVFIYLVGRKLKDEAAGFCACVAFVAPGNALVSYVFDTPRVFPVMYWTIYKPHEILGAVFAVAWFISIVDSFGRPRMSAVRILLSGAAGGALILLYYPWFVLCAITATLALVYFKFGLKISLQRLWKGAAILFIAAAVSAVYWFPYLSAVLTAPPSITDHAVKHLSRDSFDLTKATIGLGYCGFLFWGIVFVFVRRDRYRPIVKAMLILAGILYLYFLSAFVTYPLFHHTFLSFKTMIPLYAVASLISGIALSEWLQTPIGTRLTHRSWAIPVLMLLWMPTVFQWNRYTDEGIFRAARPFPKNVSKIARLLGENKGELTVVASLSAALYLPAVSQNRLYVMPNSHYNNPLVAYFDKKKTLDALSQIKSPKTMAGQVDALGIDAFIFEKKKGEIVLKMRLSDSPKSLEGHYEYGDIRFDRQAFALGFDKIYEDSEFAVFILVRKAKL